MCCCVVFLNVGRGLAEVDGRAGGGVQDTLHQLLSGRIGEWGRAVRRGLRWKKEGGGIGGKGRTAIHTGLYLLGR